MKKTIYVCDVCKRTFKPLPFEGPRWLSIFDGAKRMDFCPKCKSKFNELLELTRSESLSNE